MILYRAASSDVGLAATAIVKPISVMSRFETKILAQPENLTFLMNLGGIWVDRVHKGNSPKQIILDMDSSLSPTYGDHEGSAYHGYFECTCYHRLFCFNQYGALIQLMARSVEI